MLCANWEYSRSPSHTGFSIITSSRQMSRNGWPAGAIIGRFSRVWNSKTIKDEKNHVQRPLRLDAGPKDHDEAVSRSQIEI